MAHRRPAPTPKVFLVVADRGYEALRTSLYGPSASHADPAAVAASKAPVAQPASSSQKSVSAKAPSKSIAPKDTVQISSAAQSALQEATETAAQTAKEARAGDRQAVRLLAKEEAKKG